MLRDWVGFEPVGRAGFGMQVKYWVGNNGILCNGAIRPAVVDKIQSNNRTNRIKLRCPIVTSPVHGSPDGRTLPFHGYPFELETAGTGTRNRTEKSVKIRKKSKNYWENAGTATGLGLAREWKVNRFAKPMLDGSDSGMHFLGG